MAAGFSSSTTSSRAAIIALRLYLAGYCAVTRKREFREEYLREIVLFVDAEQLERSRCVAIVVVGAGAIGLLVAGKLTCASTKTALLARPAIAAAIAQHRLRILQGGVVQIVDDLTVATDPTALDQCAAEPELAILCVKGYDTAGALPAIEALQPRMVLTLQNGIGNEELLAERFGARRVISGAITSSVEIEAPGRIAVTKSGGIGLAPMDRRVDIRPWIATLGAAGFRTRLYSDYRALKWSKALLNMLGNATAAILDMSVAAVYADRRLVALEHQAFREALAVMDRLGIRPVNLPRYPVAVLALAMRYGPAALLDPLLGRLIAGGRGGKTPSLHLDLARGNRRSEGDLLYGAVVRAAEQVGLVAPTNRVLHDTLRDLASGTLRWDDYRHNPDRLLTEVAGHQTFGNR
jgi:2-dehydropantoate 2-reductase